MELRQLNYFIKAAEYSSFTEASRKLFISQSALSQQIKQLEQELDILLFNRVGKRIQLTEAGSLFLTHAKQTSKTAENAKQMIVDLQNLQVGTLYIGVTYGLTALFTEALILFSKQFPNIKVRAYFRTSDELMDKLKSGELDFILSFHGKTDDSTITTIPLFKSFLTLVVHDSHELADKQNINLYKLNTINLAITAEGFTARKVLEAAYNKDKLLLDYQIELNHIPTILQLVNTGKWATVLTEYTMRHLPTLKSIPINNKKLTLSAGIRHLKENYQKKASTAFFELIMNQH